MMNAYFRITSNPYPSGPTAGDGEPISLSYKPDRLVSGFKRVWITGERFAQAPPLPLEASIEQAADGRLLDFYQMPLCVMSSRLEAFFNAAVIDNIDFYPTVLVDLANGQTRTDYVAFNVIGLVAAADLSRSRYDDFGEVKMFDAIALDPRHTRGTRMFRMAESPGQILVDASVKALAEAQGLTSLLFHPVEMTP